MDGGRMLELHASLVSQSLMHAFDENNVNEPDAMSIRIGQTSEKPR